MPSGLQRTSDNQLLSHTVLTISKKYNKKEQTFSHTFGNFHCISAGSFTRKQSAPKSDLSLLQHDRLQFKKRQVAFLTASGRNGTQLKTAIKGSPCKKIAHCQNSVSHYKAET